jgi:hypothetical protein
MTTLTSPVDLLSAVPFMIGFTPQDSLVVMGLRNEAVEVAMRLDFPENLDLDQISTIVTHLRSNSVEEALLVSYIPESVTDADVVIKALSEALESGGFPLRESLIVVAGRWRSLVCTDGECCPMEGQPLPPLDSSRIAAEQIALGNPLPFSDESAMLEALEPFPLNKEIEEWIAQIPEIDDESNSQPLQQEGAEAIIDLITDFESDGICRDKRLVALVLVRLKDLQVRDFALGSVTEERSTTFFDAYRWLMRMAPVGYVAPIASIFAAICYERGDGALAQRALQRAIDDDPQYPLADLLRQLFATGKRPEIFREMRAELHPKVCASIFSGTMSA